MTCDRARELAAGYVLGALDADEESEVREHLASCPEAHPEFADLGGVVPYLAESVEPVEPPAGLKARILAAAAADLAAPTTAAPSPALATFPGPAERDVRDARRDTRGRPARMPTPRSSWLLGLAAALAIVALGGWNLALQGQMESLRRYDRAVATVVELAGREGSQVAVLTPADGDGPRGIAAIGADGRVVVAMRNLAPTEGREVYETWVIGADGQPVPIGGFTVGADRTGSLEVTAPAAEPGVLVAVTREPAAGATSPTLPILSRGAATAPAS